jgi:mono/diheme cytochrome c family protein
LRRLLQGRAAEIPRLHAGWTLEGLGALTVEDITTATRDSSARIRSAAVRWAESARLQHPPLSQAIVAAAEDADPRVRLQAAASLGELPAEQSLPALAALATRHLRQPYLLDAIVNAVPGREIVLLRQLAASAEWANETADKAQLFGALAGAVFRSGEIPRAQELIRWVAGERPRWQRLAVLGSVRKPTRLTAKLQWPESLTAAADEKIRTAAATLAEKLAPDTQGGTRALTAAEKDLFASGAKVYVVYCAQCHQADGRGSADTGAPLVGSKWALGRADVLAKLVLHGKQSSSGTGPVMPPWGNVLDDRHIAGILTYVRRAWGNQAAPVSVEDVRRARADSADVRALWTEDTLGQLVSEKQ